ncbi:2-amino-4-hydroxy-6-hydroxymethyldihydropteridine diphosphokinase [Cryobacterium adonitolivorans]|uniref:2-amino-4-hydroxy-6-hydroxymethyldihydropteridine diphosphokinase n=1 Tax=Cryobacterium adonitolivorans TaxID=1259189 RepID=A0A4V6QGQ0_9MICO|nr:2-amino-4-hydroxy-6-hydroxymethyldihydropteridine diphosphokinase [Cryobacterium adonitolivorans]TFC00127.1 2-amino-4-hydroxy-6-hydroxymethyldihydropteridine diphosphokinase [Cryobacterium adonitolivorans]
MTGSAPAPERTAVLALGSNLGDRKGTLAAAVRAIADLPEATLTAISPVYASDALKPDGVDLTAPGYLNLVVSVLWTGEPHALLDAVNVIETEHGRVREERWGDRTLDIDLICLGDLRLDDDRLTLPHPRAAERDFVLAPWLDIDPDAELPGRGRVRELLAVAARTARAHPVAASTDPAHAEVAHTETLHDTPGRPRPGTPENLPDDQAGAEGRHP